MSGYDSSWIIDALISREAQYSTCILFETSDPKRFIQFVNFILHSKGYSQYRIYIYWIWRGLLEARLDPKTAKIQFLPVRPVLNPSSSSPLVQTITRQIPSTARIRDLNSALTYMDTQFMMKNQIIFIIYGLYKPDDNLTSAVRAWILDDTMYEKKHIIVIFTESAHKLFDDETLKYMIYKRVPISSEEERKAILEAIVEKFKTKLPQIAKVDINALVQVTAGLTLHETESVALESIRRHRTLDFKMLQSFKSEIIRRHALLEVYEPSYGFEAVGGYDVIKDFIKKNFIDVLRNPERARRLGLRLPRGLLFFGPPGTGKTHFAKALASELKLPFLELKTEYIVHGIYGETERRMARALAIAESVAPCILFIDEVDRFGQRGKFGEHETTRRSFSILLEWLGEEERKTIIVATTNRPEDLDEAFIRVGRFDYIIPFLYPDFKARLEILKVHTSIMCKVPLAKNVDLESIARNTEMWTGSELRELVERAKRIAFQSGGDYVTMSDFEEALATFKLSPPTEARIEQFNRYLTLAEHFCNDVRFLENLRRSMNIGARLEALKEQL